MNKIVRQFSQEANPDTHEFILEDLANVSYLYCTKTQSNPYFGKIVKGWFYMILH
jgi:hypothetical protein